MIRSSALAFVDPVRRARRWLRCARRVSDPPSVQSVRINSPGRCSACWFGIRFVSPYRIRSVGPDRATRDPPKAPGRPWWRSKVLRQHHIPKLSHGSNSAFYVGFSFLAIGIVLPAARSLSISDATPFPPDAQTAVIELCDRNRRDSGDSALHISGQLIGSRAHISASLSVGFAAVPNGMSDSRVKFRVVWPRLSHFSGVGWRATRAWSANDSIGGGLRCSASALPFRAPI